MKIWYRALMVAMLLLSVVGIASANFTGPYYDTYIIVNGASFPVGPNLAIQDSTSSCNDSYVSFIQFDASNILTVDTATLRFTVGGTPAGLNNNPTLTLYGVADFDPATLNGTNYPKPSAGLVIQNIVIPAGAVAGYQVTYGVGDSALADYIESEANGALPQTVTLALSFSASCFTNTSLSFYSQEGGTAAQDPALDVTGTKKDPNAVALSAFSADDSKVTWPLYAGLGALGVIAAVAVGLSRRRAAQR